MIYHLKCIGLCDYYTLASVRRAKYTLLKKVKLNIKQIRNRGYKLNTKIVFVEGGIDYGKEN
jgi:hypothetical protein